MGAFRLLCAGKKKAEARVQQLEEHIEAVIAEKVSQKENELNATYDEKMRNYEERSGFSLVVPNAWF